MSKRKRSAPVTVLLSLLALALALGLVLGCGGCKKEKEIVLDQEAAPMGSGEMPGMVQVPTTVVVPPEVAREWKAVVLEVTDKDTKKVESFTLKIGETAPLGKTGLTVWVEAFLPTFSMQGESFTSTSNELNNPAARVKITDKDGKQLFYSWLFALYPTTHPLDHPKYLVILKDYKKN
jgi:hypothetical protein